MYSVSPRYAQIVSLSLLSLLVQKRCCPINDIPRRIALAKKAFSAGWTSCFSSAEMQPPPQSSLLTLEEGKILARTFRNACSLPELAMWNGTISDGKQTLLSYVWEKKSSWVSLGRIPEDGFGRGIYLQTDRELLLQCGWETETGLEVLQGA